MRAIAPRLIRLQEYGGIAPDGPDIVHKDVRHRNQVHRKSRRRGDLDEQVPASLRGQNQLQYRRHEDAMYPGKLSGPTREAVDIFGARGRVHRLISSTGGLQRCCEFRIGPFNPLLHFLDLLLAKRFSGSEDFRITSLDRNISKA